MGAPLQSVALVARTLSLIHDKPLIAVNHCIGREPPPAIVAGCLLMHHQILKWEEKSLVPPTLWSYTFPEVTPKLSPTPDSAIASLGRLWISQLEIAWTDSLAY